MCYSWYIRKNTIYIYFLRFLLMMILRTVCLIYINTWLIFLNETLMIIRASLLVYWISIRILAFPCILLCLQKNIRKIKTKNNGLDDLTIEFWVIKEFFNLYSNQWNLFRRKLINDLIFYQISNRWIIVWIERLTIY
jgi:hypothetical protein